MTDRSKIEQVRAILQNPFEAFDNLTEVEKRIAILVARDGLTLEQVGEKLGMPLSTAGYHLQQVQKKVVGVGTRQGKRGGGLQTFLIRKIRQIVEGK